MLYNSFFIRDQDKHRQKSGALMLLPASNRRKRYGAAGFASVEI
jgi:hypothetical protein